MSIELIATVLGDALKFRRLSSSSGGLGSSFMRNWRQVGMQCARIARDRVRETHASALPPNSMATVALKGSNTVLVDSGTLRDSIIAKQEGGAVFYGGIDVLQRNKNGMTMGWLATLQQVGYTIEVTPQVRALFAQAGMHLRDDTRVLVVPPRPFVMRGLEKAVDEIRKKFGELNAEMVRAARTI